MTYTYEQIMSWLKANLTPERYEHSIGTAECASELAEKFGCDKDKAYFTGLIHDCAKCLPKDETIDIINNHVTLEEGELCSPKTHHAPAGAYIAQKVFGISDEEILSAIRWHTIGKLNMSDFEKIIYLADKIETRTREDEYANPIRECLSGPKGLDCAMLQSYKLTIKSLVDRNLKICPMTIDIYNHLEDLINVN